MRRSSVPNDDHGRGRRRAFALPLVVLLALVGVLAVAILLDRFSASHLTVHRQTQDYTAHHSGLGIKEVTGRWLTTVRGRVEQCLDADGLAYRLELPHGEQIEVYMEDGQGAALTELTAVEGRQREILTDMRDYLEALPPAPPVLNATRPAGPPEISLLTAPRQVLDALAYAIVEPKAVKRVADALDAARSGEGDPRAALTTALSELSLSDQERDELQGMLTTSPVLYRIEAQTVDARDRIIARSGGLMIVGGQTRADSISQTGPFLTWEELPIP